MKTVSLHHNPEKLPSQSDNILPVLLYGVSKNRKTASIGSPIVKELRRLGLSPGAQVMDFLTLTLAVTAADTFVFRESSPDGWARNITLRVPLFEPEPWLDVKTDLEQALHFLSGDLWTLDILSDGYAPPKPMLQSQRGRLINLKGLDSVCLFSGGLDSGVGAIDLLSSGKKPLLVSHSYPKDKTRQAAIAKHLPGKFARFEGNADPKTFRGAGQNEISMRTRSLTFLALAAIGGYALSEVNQLSEVTVYVPENGFISINAPLTSRRIGSLSTRTTHPEFISRMQQIFVSLGINVNLVNPYQFMTKGEMVSCCGDSALLEKVVAESVSCSHWKRKRQQCGACVPCIIRRAAIHQAGLHEPICYRFPSIKDVFGNSNARDDLFALLAALSKFEQHTNVLPWISCSGPLPPGSLDDYVSIFERGMAEIKLFLQSEGVA